MLGQDADALDATQEALLTIATRLHRYDGRSAFGTWVYRVTTNACLDELRRRGRRPVAMDDEVLLRDVTTSGHDDRVATGLDVEAALARISPDFRICVVLRDLCGMDYAEIGDTLGLKPGTVRSRIARGRGALLDLLGNQSAESNVQRTDDG